jgi:hypothetical protein
MSTILREIDDSFYMLYILESRALHYNPGASQSLNLKPSTSVTNGGQFYIAELNLLDSNDERKIYDTI